jgi:asparagine synthase (glutamine-hydrolysing)
MCGLVGQIGATPPELGEATRALAHRGPDDEGVQRFRAGDLHGALGFRRLAILDLSPGGHQPMSNEDGSLWLVFNGEIYNAPTLRRTLTAAGHTFRGRSDTECILHGYELWGDDVLNALRGMFAIALWDARRERLLLARDPIGVKPLYYREDGPGISFASEMKGLFALGAPRELDPASLAEYLRYLYVPAPATIYAGIRQLPPGHRLVWEKGATRTERYFDLARVEVVPRPERVLRAELRAHLEDSVRLHLASDVPLGGFLSGGYDSSSVVALMAQASSRPVKTFTLVFGERAYNESGYAQAVSEKWHTEHTEIRVQPNLLETLPAILQGFDEPFGNPTAMLMYLLSRETRRQVTVALSGEGGDEMFLGYPRYQGAWLAARMDRIPIGLRRAAAHSIAPHIVDSTSGRHVFRRLREFLEAATLPAEEAYRNWVAYRTADEALGLLSPELAAAARSAARRDFLEACFDQAPKTDVVGRAAYVDIQSFLPHNVLAYSDRMSMAHALEVRVPFCDRLVAEFVASIPAEQRMAPGRLKRLFRAAVADLLPPVVRHRIEKVGLNPPLGVWMQKDLRHLLDEYLSPEAIRAGGLLDVDEVSNLVATHQHGGRDLSLQIWALVVLQAWHRSLDGSHRARAVAA